MVERGFDVAIPPDESGLELREQIKRERGPFAANYGEFPVRDAHLPNGCFYL